MYKILICFVSFFAVFNFGIFHPAALYGSDYKINQHQISNNTTPASLNKEELRPVLTVTPREIDLGSIKPGDTAFGDFSLKNITPGMISWSTSCPEGWESDPTQKIKGVVSSDPGNLLIELSIAENIDNLSGDKSKNRGYKNVMKMQTGGKELVCYKVLKAGTYRNAIRIKSEGGQRSIFVDFRIHALQEIPSISLNPQRLDLGVQLPGKIISKRIELTNKGREMLRWSVVQSQTKTGELSGELPKERYLSFHNEALPEPGKYVIPDHLKDSMELIGKWTEKNGYPLSKGAANSMKIRFVGTGISAFLQSHTDNGNCSIYLDEILLNLPDVLSGEWEKKELVISEGLTDGPHVVTFVIREGSLELEGVKVFGKDIMRGPRSWISVFPNSGTTMSETDYINVKVDTSNLAPGYYGDQIVFKSNAGEAKAEIFVDISSDSGQKNIDVYLYSKDKDCFFTIDPQAESKRLLQNGYLKEGIAFRLFTPQTPGTTSFYRWYNPAKRDHYYHYDRTGGGKRLDGYVYEGTIGNIATSRMTNTRELYRWFNPSTGRHYYSTNAKGAIGERKGYRFDGIAGYVR